ncbi:MAG: decaprenyl-phosphate phosphoribosyltransferase [Bacteroidota bacterium]
MNLQVFSELIRVRQWTKNLFLFLPLFFVQRMADSELVFNTLIGFFSFCFIASAIYITNDISDQNEDALHPVKKRRPIASGKISLTKAISISILCAAISLALSFFLPSGFLMLLLSYALLNLCYSLFGLKHIPILDVLIIAVGFVLRVQAGAAIGNISVSMWLNLVTFLLALFIAFAKRRDDVLIFNAEGLNIRKSIDGYNLKFLDASLSVLATVIMVCYIMYTIAPEVTSRFHSDKLYLSAVFVLAGIFRYLQLTLVEEKSGDPSEILWRDVFLQITLLGWIAFLILVIYIKPVWL